MLENSPKILIVEDSTSVRTLLALQLKKLGAEIMQACDGLVGLKIAQNNKLDLIITDVNMPNMDGLEMSTELKNDPRTRGVPIIFLSSLESSTDIDRGFDSGATAYLLKGSNDKQLISTIESVLDRSAFQKSRTIMVVDDSKTILRLVENGLSANGYGVITAQNGMDALQTLQRVRPDLIISDLDMPVMNGKEFCNALQKNQSLSSIPFMIMSANNERATMRSMIQQGATTYMVKPFHIEQLIITVEKILSEQFQLLLAEKERLANERKIMLATITSLIQALEARDSYTRGHSERVSMIVMEMAKIMNFSQPNMELIGIGARLHDLGKIGIADALLLKAGSLTTHETEIFNDHPRIGAEILKPIPSLKKILPVVLHHHERFDGKGYPGGLGGKEIPLWARMTAVADCYDALTTDRPYRKGFPAERAVSILAEIKGTQLCPICVDIFMEWAAKEPTVNFS